MDPAAFSTGITIQWPRPGTRVRGAQAFAYGAPHQQLKEENTDDETAYAACQELAAQYAMEQTKSAVRAVLLQANATCYHNVHRFFQRYIDSDHSKNTSALDPALFPHLHAFPTAAVVAGTDATFSEVWVTPLCKVLQQSFPVIFVLKDDFRNARQLVEWMAEQLDVIARARAAEETWLVSEIEAFSLQSPKAQTEAKTPVARRLRGQESSRVKKKLAKHGPQTRFKRDEGDEASSYEDVETEEFEDESDVDEEDNGPKDKKAPKRGRRPATSRTVQAYAKWTMTQLLVKLQTELNRLMARDDSWHGWMSTLRELIYEQFKARLRLAGTDLEASIECYTMVMDWIKNRIVLSRALPASTKESAFKICSTEAYLAQILHGIMQDFVSFLEKARSSKPEEATMSLLDRWHKKMTLARKRNEDYYQLYHFDTKKDLSSTQRPFVLLCIEQLEAFDPQVLEDFLVVWTNFTRRQEKTQPMRLGMIVGVASSASPALRRMNISIVSRIDMQFFMLEDSRKCFANILEALVVDTNLPLCLSGNVLRWIAGRHRTTQSITMFMHALAFLCFSHFKHVPWSFLSHFCLDNHWRKPFYSPLTPQSKELALWVRRYRLPSPASSLVAYLRLFGNAKLKSLQEYLYGAIKPDPEWQQALERGCAQLRVVRRKWAIGWKCFRTACSWLDIELAGEEFVAHLALALDGKLANTKKIHTIVQKLALTPLHIVICLIDDWKTTCEQALRFGDDEELGGIVGRLDSLILLCRYALETESQQTTQRVLLNLRQEIADSFVDLLIVALVRAPIAANEGSGDTNASVVRWLHVTDVKSLELHLHFNYHDRLKDLLMDIEEQGVELVSQLWVHDVSLAFLFYQESAGIYLSLHEWYETFAAAVKEESEGVKEESEQLAQVDESEIKARFIRAFCTLRHWGFVRSSGSNENTIEKAVFI